MQLCSKNRSPHFLEILIIGFWFEWLEHDFKKISLSNVGLFKTMEQLLRTEC